LLREKVLEGRGLENGRKQPGKEKKVGGRGCKERDPHFAGGGGLKLTEVGKVFVSLRWKKQPGKKK